MEQNIYILFNNYFVLWDFCFCFDIILLKILIILFNFCSKFVWSDGINLFVISNTFLLMNQILLKIIVIVINKLTKSRVLRYRIGIRDAPRGENGVGKFFPLYRVGWGWNKTKLCEVGAKTPSFEPVPPHCHP